MQPSTTFHLVALVAVHAFVPPKFSKRLNTSAQHNKIDNGGPVTSLNNITSWRIKESTKALPTVPGKSRCRHTPNVPFGDGQINAIQPVISEVLGSAFGGATPAQEEPEDINRPAGPDAPLPYTPAEDGGKLRNDHDARAQDKEDRWSVSIDTVATFIGHPPNYLNLYLSWQIYLLQLQARIPVNN